MNNAVTGQLVIVGFGIQLGRHLTQRAINEIAAADRVVCLVDPLALAHLKSLRPDVISLHTLYGDNKDRRQTYREMEAAMVEPVRAGQKVCAVFYGHPGVFADAPHGAIRTLRSEGLPARMEAGISAEACLYADLNIDPGRNGTQSMEATQFLFFERPLDPTALLLLWQVGLVGDTTCKLFTTTSERLAALASKLMRWHPPEHEVILYEASQVAIAPHRAEHLPLSRLHEASTTEITTLVIPPSRKLAPDWAALASLGLSEEALR